MRVHTPPPPTPPVTIELEPNEAQILKIIMGGIGMDQWEFIAEGLDGHDRAFIKDDPGTFVYYPSIIADLYHALNDVLPDLDYDPDDPRIDPF